MVYVQMILNKFWYEMYMVYHVSETNFVFVVIAS